MTLARGSSLTLAAFAGVLSVLSFAPFGFAGLPVATLALLFGLWGEATTREAAWRGFAFGAGLFGAGVSWVYIALETFGGMPPALTVIATAGFVAYLALFPAAAGWLTARFTPPGTAARTLAGAAAWTLFEWLRGNLLSGFSWLAVGYAQLPASPLRGFAPIGGVYLASLAVALCAALLWIAIDALPGGRWRAIVLCVLAGCGLAAVGAGLATIGWTHDDGAPVPVSLVQGNVPQEFKFEAQFRDETYALYGKLVDQSRGKLVVLPESAFPTFADQIPDEVVEGLLNSAQARDGMVLVGLFLFEPPGPGEDDPRYFNSVASLGGGKPQFYRKHHLVPFGETLPGKPLTSWFIRSVLSIPLADQTPGASRQPPFIVDGVRFAVNICYEDAFGDEMIASAREAGVLLNVTNDAWYGRSIAARQHHQIAAMRALELGRPMLRATNTGITSSIAPDGNVVAELPWFTRGVLEVTVQGRGGETPYMRMGDALVLVLGGALFVAAWAWGRRKRHVPAAAASASAGPVD